MKSPIHTLACFVAIAPLALGSAGCSTSGTGTGEKTDAEYEAEVVTQMHALMLTDIQTLHAAAEDLGKAAPAPKGRGWDAAEDADAIFGMKEAWLRARSAYERTEGAIAPLFPEIDVEIDERYDGFLEALGDAGDQNLFDDEGVIGMHAIERILFADSTPEAIVTLEATLPGGKAAAWPATEQEASDFKTKLCTRLARDTQTLQDQWQPQRIDLPQAYQGLIDLMAEQREKVNKAASEEEESRYSQRTMADIRDNLEGTRRAYALFKPWLEAKPDGVAIDESVMASFETLDGLYGAVKGDAFPPAPANFSSEAPSAEDLATPFGKLFAAVNAAVDPNLTGSTVNGMILVADALGFSELVQ